MEKFTVLSGVAAPLVRPNINTDVLIRIERTIAFGKGQLGPWCFETWRYREDRSPDPGFILNRPPFDRARILITGPNFGCGSSREQAVWSLIDMGFRAVIAPSFGEIFFGNCFQNGMLPIVLPHDTVEELAAEAERAGAGNGAPFTIDLGAEEIVTAEGRRIAFSVDPARRRALLEGLDEIGMTLTRQDEIAAFQATDRARRPWIYPQA